MNEEAPEVHDERVTTGNPMLDEMLNGGLPQRHLVVIAGPAGAGKTISALQFVYGNLKAGKKCMFVSASDDEETLVRNAKKFGWDFEPYIESGQLKIIKLKLVEVEKGLISDVFEQLPRMLKSVRPEILVIDSITEFDDLCTSDLERRGRLLHLRELLKELGITALLTAEAAPSGLSTKYGIVEYIADGFILQSRFVSDDYSQFLHIIQIIKMRWTNHSRETRAYNITSKGIEIYSPLYTILASMGKMRV